MSTEHEDQELRTALNQLGENLKQLGKTAWNSPERRQMQAELEKAVKGIEGTLQQAGKEFQESETGQRLKRDVERIKNEFEVGEFEKRARAELAALVHQLNQKLESWLQAGDSPSDHEQVAEEME